MAGNKVIGLITAICFVVTCFLTIPSFASSPTGSIKTLSSDGTTASFTNSSIRIESLIKTDNTSGAAVDIASVTTSAAVDMSSTATGSAVNTSSTPGAIDAAKAEDDEKLWYRSKIPMKKEHQKLLWDYCKKRNLEYIDMLALISLESNFNEKCSSTRFKGYFQIGTFHGPNLSKTLKTANKPLDGAININWGTAMYSWILMDKRVKDLKGKKQRDVALSIYQRGSGGYNNRGISYSYLKVYYKRRDIIVSYFEK